MPTVIIHEGLFYMHLVASNSTPDYTAGICVTQTPTFHTQASEVLIYKNATGQYGWDLTYAPSKQVELRLQNETFEGEIDSILSYFKRVIEDDITLALIQVSETSLSDPEMSKVSVTDTGVYSGIVFDENQDTTWVLEFDPRRPPGHVLHDPMKQTCAVVLYPNRLKVFKVKKDVSGTPAWLDLLAGDD